MYLQTISDIYLRGGIEAVRSEPPAGRRANPPEADIVENSTDVERGKAE